MTQSVETLESVSTHRRDWLLATLAGAAIAVLGGLIGLGGAEFRLPY